MYPAFSITHDAQARYHSVSQIPQESDIFGFSVGKAYYQKLLNIDITKIATKYRGPVLIVHGTSDDVVPIKYVERAAHNFPNATFKKITGAGHGFEGSDQQRALHLLDNFVTKTQRHSERG
ncbi:alpha/beta hydrolase [Lactiplantibacillus garii]|uniref:Alpha/beta hydrolase n=1 Tax=Lactiplantibacillus garii TaxID=2306423 RepID=A0A426D5P1_9LACO|nr:alpha/beta hydrolase [Lactiplantibacillus garii]RRK09952.1 alpha/beta hydrolase [Lactiplantibacillus garii]